MSSHFIMSIILGTISGFIAYRLTRGFLFWWLRRNLRGIRRRSAKKTREAQEQPIKASRGEFACRFIGNGKSRNKPGEAQEQPTPWGL